MRKKDEQNDSNFLADISALKQDSKKDAEGHDWRHITNGSIIPTEYYSDQPYIIKTDDEAWLCTLTTGAGHEGQSGQHVVSMRSTDMGKTWFESVDVEPGDGPEASYAVLLKVPYGRIYCFYNHNTDNIRSVKAEVSNWYPDGICTRVDSLGYFVFKYSDDNGKTWSEKRYSIPSREFEIDRNNIDQSRIRYFWNVGKPFVLDGAAYVSLHKVGGFGEGFFIKSEGVLLKSENILTEKNPEKITWETLPDGDIGLRTPSGGGAISEEQSYTVLSDGTIYCVYRSVDGRPVFSYSRDGGHIWDEPQYKKYADGRLMKHPRAANFAWKCSNGKYLYWFHNHGGKNYEDRNPVWVCGGIEEDTDKGKIIKWTQPEIMLYDDDTYIRMSYPDLIEEDGKLFITETQKDIARVHEIDNEFLDVLWRQFEISEVCKRGLLLEINEPERLMTGIVNMPKLPELLARDMDKADYGTKDLRNGFSIDIWLNVSDKCKEVTILDSRTEDGMGLCLKMDMDYRVEIIINDGRTQNSWKCDPGMIKKDELNHITVIVDGGPKIITFVTNGILNDGGEFRQFGWGRFSPNLRHAKSAEELRMMGRSKEDIKSLRIYSVALTTTEAIGNFRSGV